MVTGRASSSGTSLADVLAVAVAGIFQVSVNHGPPNSWNVMTGAILICILASHRITGSTRFFEILALSTTWALTLILTFGVAAYRFFPDAVEPDPDPDVKPWDWEIAPIYHFWVWAVLTLAVAGIFFAIRRHRRRTQADPASDPAGPSRIASSDTTT